MTADKIIMLIAEFFLAQKKGAVVFDVKCSNQLPILITKFGGQPIMEKTGHFNIKKRIRETNAVMGGEMSGHIFINHDWYGFDDAIFSAVILIYLIFSPLGFVGGAPGVKLVFLISLLVVINIFFWFYKLKPKSKIK